MSQLLFRNVDASPDDPVASWPFEAVVAAIERGMLSDWRLLGREVKRSPWGRTARHIEDYAQWGDEKAVAALLLTAVGDARASSVLREREEAASRVRDAVRRSGMLAQSFARECGTSAARLSTYSSGKVQPSAAMLIRIEHTADALAGTALAAR